jgi:hypothetical protein
LNLGHIGINSVRVYHIEIKHHVGYIITLPNPTIPSIQIQPDPSESFESILGLELYYLDQDVLLSPRHPVPDHVPRAHEPRAEMAAVLHDACRLAPCRPFVVGLSRARHEHDTETAHGGVQPVPAV